MSLILCVGGPWDGRQSAEFGLELIVPLESKIEPCKICAIVPEAQSFKTGRYRLVKMVEDDVTYKVYLYQGVKLMETLLKGYKKP